MKTLMMVWDPALNEIRPALNEICAHVSYDEPSGSKNVTP
jgi:hypothetical protein